MTPKKILFANVPFDGHFNPLVPLATHLLQQGHDVRWYTGSVYRSRVEKFGIRFYPCVRALDISQDNLNELFPDRLEFKNPVARLKYDIKHAFIVRSTEYFEDIKDISKTFDFDLVIADVAFAAVPFIKHKLNKPVITIGVLPLTESSVDLAPNGLGLTPAKSFAGRLNQRLLRYLTDVLIFKESKQLIKALYRKYDIKPVKGNMFDVIGSESNLLLQIGTPGFEYYRSDLSKNIRFIGPLLPAKTHQPLSFTFEAMIKQYKRVVLVTQGTVEKDPSKIMIPTLEAFKNDPDVLVIATTGGSQTNELRARYNQANIIIVDFLPFDTIMKHADVFVTNGGYGGVMLSIANRLPMVVAGVQEGKNEICARVGYFNLGIDLKTEVPEYWQIRKAVKEVTSNKLYQQSIDKLQQEFAAYHPLELIDQYVNEVLYEYKKKTAPRFYALFELEAA